MMVSVLIELVKRHFDSLDFVPIGGSSKKDRTMKLKESSTSTKKREKK